MPVEPAIDFKASTPHHQMVLQRMHDLAAASGAKCANDNDGDEAKMAASHELKAMQAVHDTATSHGAACSAGMAVPSLYYSKDEDMSLTDTDKKSILDGLIGFFKENFSREPEKKEDVKDAGFTNDPKLVEALIQSQAVSFATELVASGKIVPAQRDAAVSIFSKARAADIASTAVTFSDAPETGEMVKTVIALFSGAQPHGLTKEQVAETVKDGEPKIAKFEQDGDLPTSEDIEKLINMSPIGQGILETIKKEQAGVRSDSRSNGQGGF